MNKCEYCDHEEAKDCGDGITPLYLCGLCEVRPKSPWVKRLTKRRTKRECLTCKKKLPPGRYFYHKACNRTDEDQWGDHEYVFEGS